MQRETSSTAGALSRFRLVRSWLTAAAVVVAFAAPLTVMAGAAGVRWRVWSLHVGFDWLAMRIAPALAVVGLALGALALSGALIAPQRGRVAALTALVVAALTFALLAEQRVEMAKAPPIHDVDTDWTRPLLFSPKLMLVRGPGANPIETNPVVPWTVAAPALAGQLVAVVNARTCAAATPVTLTVSPAKAYVRVVAAARRLGLRIVTDTPGDGVLEATEVSTAFGFHDDLAVRVRSLGAGSRIDLRASAREGTSDFGRDCRLVARLRQRLAARAEVSESFRPG